MSDNQREFRFGKLAIHDMQIGAANAAGVDFEKYLTGFGPRIGNIPEHQWLFGRFENHRFHRILFLFEIC